MGPRLTGETDDRGDLLQREAVWRVGAPGQPWQLSDCQRRKLSAEVSGLHPCALGCKNQRPGEVVQVEGLD